LLNDTEPRSVAWRSGSALAVRLAANALYSSGFEEIDVQSKLANFAPKGVNREST